MLSDEEWVAWVVFVFQLFSGRAGSRASAQSGRRLVLMSSLFIKSTQGGCASA